MVWVMCMGKVEIEVTSGRVNTIKLDKKEFKNETLIHKIPIKGPFPIEKNQ